MTDSIDWGVVEDQIALDEGKQPALVSRYERQQRVLAVMVEILKLAGNLGITKAALAKELGVSRPRLYRWQHGTAVASMRNYCGLLRLYSHLRTLSFKTEV